MKEIFGYAGVVIISLVATRLIILGGKPKWQKK